MKKKSLLLFSLFLFLFSCRKENHLHTFYYWRTELKANDFENKALDNSEISILYTRFFDVHKVDGKFQPIAILTKDSIFKTNKEIVPVVFIKNEALYKVQNDELDSLSKNIYALIQDTGKNLSLTLHSEIQIDCDWTATTQVAYFQLLEKLKKQSQDNISCTLRLHQVAEKEKVGVPPVSKVYLMCYATSSPLEDNGKNSILDVPILKQYLKNLNSYPLPVDVALPIYSWGIVTNHLNKHKLINGITNDDLDNENFISLGEHRYEVKNEGFYFGNYLSKGFIIKIEIVSQQTLIETIEYLDTKLSHYDIIYFHLDGTFIKNYSL